MIFNKKNTIQIVKSRVNFRWVQFFWFWQSWLVGLNKALTKWIAGWLHASQGWQYSQSSLSALSLTPHYHCGENINYIHQNMLILYLIKRVKLSKNKISLITLQRSSHGCNSYVVAVTLITMSLRIWERLGSNWILKLSCWIEMISSVIRMKYNKANLIAEANLTFLSVLRKGYPTAHTILVLSVSQSFSLGCKKIKTETVFVTKEIHIKCQKWTFTDLLDQPALTDLQYLKLFYMLFTWCH